MRESDRLLCSSQWQRLRRSSTVFNSSSIAKADSMPASTSLYFCLYIGITRGSLNSRSSESMSVCRLYLYRHCCTLKSEAFMISGALILCVSSKPCLFLPICICHPWDLTIHAFGTTGHSKRDRFTGFSADVYCSSSLSGKLVLLNFTEILACISYSYLPCSCN